MNLIINGKGQADKVQKNRRYFFRQLKAEAERKRKKKESNQQNYKKKKDLELSFFEKTYGDDGDDFVKTQNLSKNKLHELTERMRDTEEMDTQVHSEETGSDPKVNTKVDPCEKKLQYFKVIVTKDLHPRLYFHLLQTISS